MSLQSLPPALKSYQRFLKQAEHLDKMYPQIAYFCRLYVIDQIMAAGGLTKEIKLFLGALMTKIEQDGKALEAQGLATTKEEGQPACEQLALSIFGPADEADRAGQANKSTAMAFYASSTIIEVCKYFGPLSPDLGEKMKYALWKSADINKALKEGRVPMAGSPFDAPPSESGPSESSSSGQVDFISSPPPSSSSGFPDLNTSMANLSILPQEQQPNYSFQQQQQHVQFDPLAASGPSSGVSNFDFINNPTPNPVSPIPTPDPFSGYNFPSVPTPQAPSAPAMPVQQQRAPVQPPQQPRPVMPAAVPTPYHPVAPSSSSSSVASAGPRSLSSADLSAHEQKLDRCMQAEKLLRHALSSLHFQDVGTTMSKMREAMSLLAPFAPQSGLQ